MASPTSTGPCPSSLPLLSLSSRQSQRLSQKGSNIDRPGGVYTAGRNYFHPRNEEGKKQTTTIVVPRVGRVMSLALSRPWLLRVSRGSYGYGPWLRSERGVSAVVGVHRGLITTAKVRSGWILMVRMVLMVSVRRWCRINGRQSRCRISSWKRSSRRTKISGTT